MPTVAQQLTDLVRQAAESAGHGDAPIPLEPCVPTNDPRHGDYQSNFAFRLGKALRTNPRAVAQTLVSALPPNDLVASTEVAGPGFINFRLSDTFLAAELVACASDARLGTPLDGAGRTLVIDYSSPNIAKRMHVGHMRSTIIGNALDRLYRFLGWEVIADNHLGDWGTQFGKLIVGWRNWLDEEVFEKDPIGELQRVYIAFGQRAAEDPELKAQARAETARLQAGDPENFALWQRFTEESVREFERVYERLGVRFDVALGESFYRDGLRDLVSRLLDEGVAERDQGAAVIRFGAEDGEDLEKAPLLIQKSDGAALYGTTDLATVLHRMETWNPDRIVYVTDVRQRLHFRQLFAASRKLGIEVELFHVWFGMLRFADGTVMATRKLEGGQGSGPRSVNLVDVLNMAVARAREVVDAKSSELPEKERAEIAEAVGVGAVRYSDLSQNPQTDVLFDWDKMLALEGNTAPYLMYGFARVKSIFRKSGVDVFEPGEVVLGEPIERELALAVLRTPEVILAAAATYRPNLLSDHLFQVANTFARFYHDCRVLHEDSGVRQSRLSLAFSAARTLEVGLGLLGIRALSRM
ncbi:MAG: arginine--tRNA ligase [Deltaproteobacteria bacterium]|nr:arginine--tRNA ligase [Deltaproteobacteria bacterium]